MLTPRAHRPGSLLRPLCTTMGQEPRARIFRNLLRLCLELEHSFPPRPYAGPFRLQFLSASHNATMECGQRNGQAGWSTIFLHVGRGVALYCAGGGPGDRVLYCGALGGAGPCRHLKKEVLSVRRMPHWHLLSCLGRGVSGRDS